MIDLNKEEVKVVLKRSVTKKDMQNNIIAQEEDEKDKYNRL